ncbi:AbrB family transcriptional regulator [Limibaculum sp. M0105]|uniref:AbrB family transcriptional regulator n=1 Tax=Thermohalobaculum xanthum TaxID=2753746 RepID=A0A8J7M782_9RHOB|nr:AbrB family transcriptional regulator [Thermohalobaculum xanthum]MBK0399578.1 AbrB family transcriptional regulator [Thermohalobaculum xanthum]
MRQTTLLQIKTIGIALAGTALFWAVGLPLPFLFGPMAACLAAALAGLPLKAFGQVSVGARTILGVAAGAAITPAVLQQIPGMIWTVSLVPVYIVIIALVGVPFFLRLGYDRATAWYAAMPGGLQDMIAFGAEAGADVRALSLIHATRVLIIITVAPILLTTVYDASLSRPLGEPAADLPWIELAIMAAAALVGWKAGERLGLFGASILGPLALTAALAMTGVLHFRPPREAILFAQFMIGTGIGVSYVGVTLRELRRYVLSGVAFVLVLAGLAAAFTEGIYLLDLAKPVEAFLSFAPGGQAEMIVLAIVAGADIGFVIVHHLTRIILVILGAPIAARLYMRD